MKRLSEPEVKKIVEEHELWLKTGGTEGKRAKGKRANFSDVDLSGMDFSGMDLRLANFCGADLTSADFHDADLSMACFDMTNLTNANFKDADLCEVYFFGDVVENAGLKNVNFRNADLRGTEFSHISFANVDFRKANLRGVLFYSSTFKSTDFRSADLTDAHFSRMDEANASGMIYDDTTIPAMKCPEEGSFIGFKLAYEATPVGRREKYIIKLRIPEDAKRSSATGNKCRCSKAEVLSITSLDGTETDVTEARSFYDFSFGYHLGEIVEVPDFDKCRWKECAPGIHFFMDREDAVTYRP